MRWVLEALCGVGQSAPDRTFGILDVRVQSPVSSAFSCTFVDECFVIDQHGDRDSGKADFFHGWRL